MLHPGLYEQVINDALTGELRQTRRQQTDEYHLAAGSTNPGKVFEEDK